MLRTPVLVALALCVVPASLQSIPVAQAAPLDKRELEARRDFAESRYEEALHLFAELFAQSGDPIHLRNVARCYQNLKRPAEAISAFREYLRKAKTSPLEQQQIAGYISEMEALQRLQDGAKDARGAGRETAEPSPVASLQVAPQADAPQAVAARAAATRAAAIDDAREPRLLRAEPTTPPPAQGETAEPRPGRVKQWAGVAVGAGGVALVGLGVGFSLAVRAAESDLQGTNPNNMFSGSRDAEGRRYARWQWVAYGAGAVALTAGGLLFALGWNEAAHAGRPGLHVAIGPTALGLEGNF